MYLNFYHMSHVPFHITPNPKFLFLSPSHKEALATIVYGIKEKKGFIVIMGEVGVGKTTIIRSYLDRIDRKHLKTICIFNANVSFEDLLRTIFQEMSIRPEAEDIFGMVNQLQQVLIEEYRHGNNVALIIDEAQNIPVETLENLRMLSNLESSTDKLIQIVLIGQPEFEETLNLSKLKQLKQRIAVRTSILALTRKDSNAYIQHRLDKVATDDTVFFTKGATGLIVKNADGIPRKLNIICDNALLTGYGYKQKPVTSKIVKEAISDLGETRRFSFLRWNVTYATVFFLIVVIVFGFSYVHSEVDLSNLHNLNLCASDRTNRIKENTVSFSGAEYTIPAATIVHEMTDLGLTKNVQIKLVKTEKDFDYKKKIRSGPE